MGAPCRQGLSPRDKVQSPCLCPEPAGALTAFPDSILVSSEKTSCSSAGLARPQLMHRTIQTLPGEIITSGWAWAESLACGTMLGDSFPFSRRLICEAGLLTFSTMVELGSHRTQSNLAPYSGIIKQIKLYCPHSRLFCSPSLFLPPSALLVSLFAPPAHKAPFHVRQTVKKQRPDPNMSFLDQNVLVVISLSQVRLFPASVHGGCFQP